MMGVDYELFWSLDPISLSPFVKAFSIKQKMEDVERWQLGIYVRGAISSCLNKDNKYPKTPIFAANPELGLSEEEQRKIIKERFVFHASLINKNLRKGRYLNA